MKKYTIVNLVSGETLETTDKFEWELTADQQVAVQPNLVQVQFKNTIYIAQVGWVRIEYISTAGTREATFYRLTKTSTGSLIAYMTDKQRTGATNVELHCAE